MDITLFLAKALGLYILIVGVALIKNPDHFRKFAQRCFEDIFLSFFAGILSLIIGILMVLSHNIWVMQWPVIITIFSWLALIKGCLFLLYPQALMSLTEKMFDKMPLKILGPIYLLLGLYLCWKGFA
jgi:hypothetical protein